LMATECDNASSQSTGWCPHSGIYVGYHLLMATVCDNASSQVTLSPRVGAPHSQIYVGYHLMMATMCDTFFLSVNL
jgi:hypothetical protein